MTNKTNNVQNSIKYQVLRFQVVSAMVMLVLVSVLSRNVSAATTTLNAQVFVNYLNGLVGTTNSSRGGYCLKWAFEQYKAVGATDAKIGKSCNCAYEAGNALIQSNSRTDIPRGALVFFGGPKSQGTCSCGNHYGHVGIYVGDGYTVSIHGNGAIKKETLSQWDSWGYNYRGWGIPKNVELSDRPNDTTAPSISNVTVSEISSSGYRVTCTVTDNESVSKVQFPTWTTRNGQDDLKWHDAQANGNTYTFYVSRGDHNGEVGDYITHIYAWDPSGNQASADAGSRNLLGGMKNIGDEFCAIIKNKAAGTVITQDTSNNRNVSGRTYEKNASQLWYFTRKSNGTYKIANAEDRGYCLDAFGAEDSNGVNVSGYQDNGTVAQEWKVFEDKGGYVLIPVYSDIRTLDLENANKAEGTNVKIWEYTAGDNAIFDIIKVDPDAELKKDSKASKVKKWITEKVGEKVKETISDKDKKDQTDREDGKAEVADDEGVDTTDETDNNSCMKPGRAMLTSVNRAGKKKISVNWMADPAADGYQIQVATNKKFTKNRKCQYVNGTCTTTTTFKKLKKKTYYVRVRAYSTASGARIYGQWSDAVKIKVK